MYWQVLQEHRVSLCSYIPSHGLERDGGQGADLVYVEEDALEV